VKILWVCPTFLHPTTRGGQIRTLGMLREMHRSHEIHFAALQRPEDGEEGVAHSAEFCTRCYPVFHDSPTAGSAAFYVEAARGVFSGIPLAVSRWRSEALRQRVSQLLREQRFDHLVCDFLAAAPNIPAMERATLFQHNVETVIWERLRDKAANPLHRLVFRYEASRMLAYERAMCRAAAQVVAVSEEDAGRMRELFDIARISAVPTGVDLEFFARPAGLAEGSPRPDLVFSGSMNWAPNVDGVTYFCEAILPLILTREPGCRVTIVGRTPPPAITKLAESHPNVLVTGTVADIRPYLWGAKVCIVPLRIGGGTRLKIYEAMAAGVPVVSTSVGAEGLPVTHGENVLLADEPEAFAEACLELLADAAKRQRISAKAYELAAAHSWKQAAESFEGILEGGPRQ
jgi:polysaccharide biosynthesis protein PslH